MKTSEFIVRYSSGSGYEFSHARDEFLELVEEITKFNRAGVVEEFDDTVMTVQLWLHCLTGWDWTMLVSERTFKKYRLRMKVWQRIFSRCGLEFHPRYLRGGGNYRRAHKREAALRAACAEQSA
jgi:hypothetical protein